MEKYLSQDICDCCACAENIETYLKSFVIFGNLHFTTQLDDSIESCKISTSIYLDNFDSFFMSI